MADGKVVFQIDGDARGVKTTIKNVTADIEKESKKWDKACESSAESAESSWVGAFKGIGIAAAAAAVAKVFIEWSKAAVQAASDLQEVQNVVDVTFGDSARQIQTWSEQAGKQYGLTETQAKRYASTIGAMLKSQGVANEQMLSMSKDLAGLAADMASFYNLDFDTAFEKIRAGISGETMPLKQLGINMSVANLEAFALSQGIEKSYSAMSQGEQTLLRYQYLMKATADAQGDFARTSDGFANATRRIQSALQAITVRGGNKLLDILAPSVNNLASSLERLADTPVKTVLDDFADIDAEYIAGIDRLNATVDKANDLVNVMRNLEAQTVSLGNGQFKGLASLFEDIANVERNGGNARDYLSGLGLDADAIYQKYQVWNESVKQLTSSIPSLNAVINEQTGAIDGGTAAIQRNVDEFQAAEEKKLRLTAYYAKARAIEEKRGELYTYQFAVDAANQKVKRLRENLISTYDWVTASAFGDDNLITQEFAQQNGSRFIGDVIWAFDEYTTAVNDLNTANAELTVQTEAFSEAEQQLADAKQYLIDLYNEEIPAINSVTGATIECTEEAKTALKALADYVQGVHDATAQAVDGIVNGFAVLERPTTALEEKRSKLIEQQNELNRSTRDGAKRYEELQAQIDDLNKSLDAYSPKGMQDALQSQLAFMDEYIKNLEKAQQMGLSNDLLASLSDGSVQSAEYLASLVASPAQAAEVDALFQQVQAKKNEFTDALTEQKLTVDETYQGMVDTAKAAIEDMRMGAEASEATAETVQGMIDGLKSKMPALSDEIDAILAELNRLNGFGISIDLSHTSAGASAFGERFFGDRNIAAHETGLDYVPFDGYLASLHEGESILTAEENRIWQRFKNGSAPQSMDYDALGATMRENVQAGGNVYLDGKTVGRVISDQQGNSYRQLQRSGWQA